ncbi:MAG: replication-associated recombination protein A, partial [Candidatus Marinimicrobia bacterium]|nr:replication-associated recombination protein A [Candidatus Neomarinimicrobiota bacterium]
MPTRQHQPDLFQNAEKSNLPPLADRVRPGTLDDFVGHEHLVDEGRLLRQAMESGKLFSIIFWGPPGSGKTTLARLLANQSAVSFVEISAVASGVKEVRQVLDMAAADQASGRQTVLFIDEIHRFNKTQQDALLHAAEDGTVILIGATTENPSFEVISPLLSRCQVIRLEPYSPEHLGAMLDNALSNDIILARQEIELSPAARQTLVESAGGDARKMFNALEIAGSFKHNDPAITISRADINEALQERNLLYDRTGDYHYDTISAYIKSLRGSDPDAAIYWLAVMLEGGEKPEFIARRLVILASEDIGNADPQALQLATATMQAVHLVGMPEAAIILAQATTYLAAAPKSNASYLAISAARQHV